MILYNFLYLDRANRFSPLFSLRDRSPPPLVFLVPVPRIRYNFDRPIRQHSQQNSQTNPVVRIEPTDKYTHVSSLLTNILTFRETGRICFWGNWSSKKNFSHNVYVSRKKCQRDQKRCRYTNFERNRNGSSKM